VQRASLVIHVLFLSQYYVSSPFAFPCSFGNPALVLTTNMAAYVYRNIRLGFYRDHTVSSSAWNQAIDQLGAQSHQAHGLSIMLPFDGSTTNPELSDSESKRNTPVSATLLTKVTWSWSRPKWMLVILTNYRSRLHYALCWQSSALPVRHVSGHPW